MYIRTNRAQTHTNPKLAKMNEITNNPRQEKKTFTVRVTCEITTLIFSF